MLAQGAAFIREGHVFFILSDPAANNGRVLCVNITTLDEDCPDDECILDHSDYGWIEHKSAVAFSRARVWELEKIEDCISRGLLTVPSRGVLTNTLPKATLYKILKAALSSRELSKEKKRLL